MSLKSLMVMLNFWKIVFINIVKNLVFNYTLVMENLTALKEFFLSLGISQDEIQKILTHINIRDIDIIKIKIEDYSLLLHCTQTEVIKMICAYPAMLGMDTISKSTTSVSSKIKSYATLLQIDEAKVIEMICSFPVMLGYDTNSESETSVKGKIKSYVTLLQIDESKVIKMICSHPEILGYDVNSENETSVKGKIKSYATLFQIDEAKVVKMICSYPIMLSFDTNSDGPQGVKSKLQKFIQFIPLEQIVDKPKLLGVPQLSFKIRYLMANNFDYLTPGVGILNTFLSRNFLFNEKKVWARYCGITNKSHGIKLSCIYYDEKQFQKYIGKESKDLMQQYPLDINAVHQIEQEFLRNTGLEIKLDAEELAVLGLTDKQSEVNDGTKTL